MTTYYDKYSRLHHKHCKDGEPSSNNSWLYTAYEDKLAPIKSDRLLEIAFCFRQCKQVDPETGRLYLIRSPCKDLPPMSRDEILGLAQLGFLKPKHLQDWNFSPYPIPKFNPIKLVQQLWQLSPDLHSDGTGGYELVYKHRNYFWENKLDQIYRFAFSVPLVDRNFILQTWGKFNPIYWAIAKVDSLFGKPSGIRWLKYGKSLEAMQEEFPMDHPLRNHNV